MKGTSETTHTHTHTQKMKKKMVDKENKTAHTRIKKNGLGSNTG